ncbi:hypothetical protein CGK40_24295 [Vibrio parahaemolyticus]|uniref:hypothetical protein n=1 Tax=Vibrio parahaemolyticus TaxID=670 RepID=UPI00111FD7F7|nr:hypothetical protein [Vibrio parahaemolyticus]TNZ86770.1 hypothetical protein CGK40_24295 [Vibrio parahaemolyticus]
MKKHAIVMALLSAGLMTQAVNAAPASSMLEWRGFVSGAFDGTDIGLTGLGGGDIQMGELNVDSDGAFSSARPIVVEAHAIDDSGTEPVVSEEMYGDSEVAWSISSTQVSPAAYDLASVQVLMNGEPMVTGTPVTTPAARNVAAFSVSSPASTDVDALIPGDAVSVTTLIFAEPSVAAPGR